MLVLHNGPAQVSSIHQRKGRTGYYITVATPKSLRAKLGNSIRKKVGNTHKEALANRSKVEAEIQRQIGKELNQLSLVEEVQESYKKNDLSELPKDEKEILKIYIKLILIKKENQPTLRRLLFGKNLTEKQLTINCPSSLKGRCWGLQQASGGHASHSFC